MAHGHYVAELGGPSPLPGFQGTDARAGYFPFLQLASSLLLPGTEVAEEGLINLSKSC